MKARITSYNVCYTKLLRVEAEHQCMTTRGIHKHGVSMVTSTMLGIFREDPKTRKEFLDIIGNPVNRSS